jgi:hypothetical protein
LKTHTEKQIPDAHRVEDNNDEDDDDKEERKEQVNNIGKENMK